MSERNWTPGPWRVNGTKSVRGPEGAYIATANWRNGSHNAQLIAAAPDLYEAGSAIAEHELFYDREYLSAELNEKLDALRAALAKARGEA